MDWWNKLTELQKLYASFAIPATLFMVVQLILQLVGFAGGDGADSADSGDAADGIDIADGAGEIDMGDVGDGIDIADGADGIGIGDAAGGIDIADGADGADAADLHTGLQFSGEPSNGIDSAETHGTIGEDTGQPDNGDGDGHEKANVFRLFSFRSIVAFFAIGGWTGIVAIDWNASVVLSVILAMIAGWVALCFVAWIIGVFLRMQQSGNVRLGNAVGTDGEVYLTIPLKGMGKVNVIVQERLCEFNAVTEAGRVLKTGEKITVVGVASEGVLLVTPTSSPEGAITKNFD